MKFLIVALMLAQTAFAGADYKKSQGLDDKNPQAGSAWESKQQNQIEGMSPEPADKEESSADINDGRQDEEERHDMHNQESERTETLDK